MKKHKLVKCVVACEFADLTGKPDFFFCIVKCSQEQYYNMVHYDRAKEYAEALDYEGEMVVFVEKDGPKWLFEHFDWKSAIILD